MVVAVFGCVFGILGILTIGIIFVPLAALCALFGLLSGISNFRPPVIFLSIIAGLLTAAGWLHSPTLIVATAALFATH